MKLGAMVVVSNMSGCVCEIPDGRRSSVTPSVLGGAVAAIQRDKARKARNEAYSRELNKKIYPQSQFYRSYGN